MEGKFKSTKTYPVAIHSRCAQAEIICVALSVWVPSPVEALNADPLDGTPFQNGMPVDMKNYNARLTQQMYLPFDKDNL